MKNKKNNIFKDFIQYISNIKKNIKFRAFSKFLVDENGNIV